MIRLTIIYHKDSAYVVKRIIKCSLNPILSSWKEHLVCDTILKRNDEYYFCERIIDLDDNTGEGSKD